VIAQAIIFPMGSRQRKKATRRKDSQGQMLDAQRKHRANNLEKENPKHSPSPKRKDLKEQLKGTPKYYAHDNLGCAGGFSVEVVLCTSARIERLFRHTRRSLLKQPPVASFPLLCFLSSSLFLLVSVLFFCLQIPSLTE
jgi:hypothetical protein